MNRAQRAGLAIWVTLAIAASVTGFLGYTNLSLGLGWLMIIGCGLWLASVVVDRLENTPVVVPDYAPLPEEGSRFYGGR